jgi:hypothetical protein
MQAVDAQPWDPSVKALTQFPSVLDNMAKNLSWTSAMGEAYHTQAADVMSAVQVLRAKAQAAGNLKSGSQIKVVQESAQVIVIQPANPQVVYVPVYKVPVKRITQGPGHMPPRSKAPMPMGVGEARRCRKTATLRTANIKRRLKEPPARYKPRTAVRLLERRVSTTTLPWVRPQTATSMRQRTVTPTKTPAVAGRTRMELPILQLPKAMEGRKRAADHQPSVEAAAEAGNPGRRVLVVRRAGAAVGSQVNPTLQPANESKCDDWYG